MTHHISKANALPRRKSATGMGPYCHNGLLPRPVKEPEVTRFLQSPLAAAVPATAAAALAGSVHARAARTDLMFLYNSDDK